MSGLRERVTRLYAMLDRLQDVAQLLVRIAVGLEFFGSGIKEAGDFHGYVAYFRSLGIPAASIQAPFVLFVEIVGGLALVAGIATRPAAALLAGTMVVALLTASIHEHHITASWHGLIDLLFIPESLLLLLLVWLVTTGAGRLSLDRVLSRQSS